MTDSAPLSTRGGVTRFVLRALLVYFVLYAYPFPLSFIPDYRSLPQVWTLQQNTDEPEPDVNWDAPDWVDEAYAWRGRRSAEWSELERDVVDWVAANLYDYGSQLDRPFGSGDPTYSYVLLSIHATIALFVALLWSAAASVIGRRDRFLAWLLPWLHLFGRYYLASVLLGYGFAKVFPSQFRFPLLGRLETPYGDGSPMNILWSFMGSSAAYTVFGGVMEVLPGLLLFFRRTALLGALAGAGVMLNVAALNYCYDVPVKLYSTHLFVVALLLAAPDARRLGGFFLRNEGAAPRDLSRPRTGWFGHLVRVLVVLPFVAFGVDRVVESYRDPVERSPLHGIWDVESFTLDGEERAPRTDDPLRFQALIVERETFGWLKTMDGSLRSVGLSRDTEQSKLTVSASSTWQYRLEDDQLVLVGEHVRQFRANPRDFNAPGEPRDPQREIRLRREGPVPDQPALPEGEGEEDAAPLAALEGRWTVVSAEDIGDAQTRRRSTPFGFDALEILPEGEVRAEYALGTVELRGTLRSREGAATETFVLSASSVFTVEESGEGRLVARGTHRGAEVEIELTRRDPRSFLLVRRGYHWINEIPLNRY